MYLDKDFINIMDQYSSDVGPTLTLSIYTKIILIIMAHVLAVTVIAAIVYAVSTYVNGLHAKPHQQLSLVAKYSKAVAMMCLLFQAPLIILLVISAAVNTVDNARAIRQYDTEICLNMSTANGANACTSAIESHSHLSSSRTTYDKLFVTVEQSKDPDIKQCLKLVGQRLAYDCVSNLINK